MHQRADTIVAGIAEIWEKDPHLAPAVWLAAEIGATLHAVHAFSVPDPITAPLAGIDLSTRKPAGTLQQDLLAALKAQITGIADNDSAIAHVVPASPAQAIIDVAEREAADLIIVGASRRGAVAGALLGTTPQRVLRASPAPVLVWRRADSEGPRRILLTTDLSDHSSAVHETGLDMIEALWDQQDVEIRSLYVAGDEVLLPPPVHQIAMRQHAEARHAEFLKQPRARRRKIAGAVRLGLAVREIVAEVDDWGADLLVLGTRGRTGVSRFLIGSVAESVSRKASCNVLMIPSAAIEPGQSGTDRLPSDDVA